MIRLLTAVVLSVCALGAPTLAAPIAMETVTFDFDGLAGLPIDSHVGLELTDPLTGLTVRFDRISDSLVALPDDIRHMPLDIVNLGDPSYGFGTGSLSPFADMRASAPTFGYLRITIDTSSLIGPYAGLQVWKMDWDMGDFFPSDDDDLWLSATSELGTAQKFLTYDNAGYTPPWGSSTYTLIQSTSVSTVKMFAGTGGALDQPNSVFYDNFIFYLFDTAGEHFLESEETPISTLGGGGIGGSSLGPTNGQPSGGTPPGVPIPEPGTVFAVAAGLAALGAGSCRKRRRD